MYVNSTAIQRGFELALDTLKKANKLKEDKKMYLDEAIKEVVVNNPEVVREDSIVNEVVENFKERSRIGILKYNTTLDRDDLSLEQWLSHAIEEAMDLTLYLTKIKKELKEKIKDDTTTKDI